MEKNGKFYSFKKKQGAGYNNELRECIENTCQYCIESTNKNSEDKINLNYSRLCRESG